MKNLISIFVAAGMFAIFLISINVYYAQRINVGAQSLTYQNTDDRNSSLVAMRAILNENSIPVFGSSELNSIDNIGFPAALFDKGNSNFNMVLIGQGSMQSLHDAISIGAMADEIEDKKVVVIISPQWFGVDGIGAEAYASRFSERLYVEMIKNKKISYETKRAISDRVLSLLQDTDPSQYERIKLFDSVYVEKTAGLADKVRSFFWNLLQDNIAVQKSSTLVSETNGNEPVKIEDVDFVSLMARAEQAAIEETSNNPFYVYDEYFNNYMVDTWKEKENVSAGMTYVHSVEYDDLELMLQVCKETDIHPMIVNIPVNGWWYDYIGMAQEARNEYYQKIREIARKYGVSILDFSNREYEPYFLRDVMHLGKKGWVYLDEAVYRYHSTKEKIFEYPFESEVNVDRGENKTTITLTTRMSDVEQARLVLRGKEIELKENSNGLLTAVSVFNELDNMRIITTGRYGAGTVIKPEVIVRNNIFNPSTLSAGVTEDENNFVFETVVSGNVFDLATFQIYDANTGDFIQNFGSTTSQGVHSGVYMHELPDGIYKVVFKINSNKSDEIVSCDLELKNGEKYSYEYDLVLLEPHRAEVEKIGLYMETR